MLYRESAIRRTSLLSPVSLSTWKHGDTQNGRSSKTQQNKNFTTYETTNCTHTTQANDGRLSVFGNEQLHAGETGSERYLFSISCNRDIASTLEVERMIGSLRNGVTISLTTASAVTTNEEQQETKAWRTYPRLDDGISLCKKEGRKEEGKMGWTGPFFSDYFLFGFSYSCPFFSCSHYLSILDLQIYFFEHTKCPRYCFDILTIVWTPDSDLSYRTLLSRYDNSVLMTEDLGSLARL